MNPDAQAREKPRAHRPQLTRRGDGRYEVRCSKCEDPWNGEKFVGIGLPLDDVYEAEGIVKNHCRDVGASRR